MTPSAATQRLRFTFRKEAGARFLSHLDLMATLEYALRRARIPVALSEGFNPRPRISLAAPLALGYTGERELLDMELAARLDPAEALRRLQGALPAGITLIEATELDTGTKGAASRIAGAAYRIGLPGTAAGLGARIVDLLARDRIEIEEEREGKMRRRNIRPFIRDISLLDPNTLHLHLAMGDAGSVRPETLLDLLRIPRDGVRITRERIDLSESV